MNDLFIFDKPLQEGILLNRTSQFVMEVKLNDRVMKCHCPTTGRIGNLVTSNIPCLVSESSNPNRKLKYTVEAVSADNLDCNNKNWIGINQILSNKLIEYFLRTHQLNKMVSDYDVILREVPLGISKLDFLVGNTYMEVKTPLTTLHVKYGSQVKTKPTTPFSSTERFTKHINELAASLQEHERAILLNVHQYLVTERKVHQKSVHFDKVSSAITQAKIKGLEIWNIDMRFTDIGVGLDALYNITDTMLYI